MQLLSTYTTFVTLGKNRYEVTIDTYKTIKEVFVRRLGWALGDTIRLRGKDYKANTFDYLRQHIAEIDLCYHLDA